MQTWNGYFTAPTTGTYVFRAIADDYFAVYISSTYGSTDPPADPLIFSNKYQPYWNDFYADDSPNAEANVSLVGGKSYYLEAYHINHAGGGYFKVEVDVPNNDTTLPLQAYEVDKVIINSTVQPEIVTYTMVGGNAGKINMRLVRTDPGTGATTYNVNKTVDYGCTDADFQGALNSFDSFSSYQISVVRNIYDSGNNIINTTVGAAKIAYVVSIYILRPAKYTTENFIWTYTNYTGTVTKTLGTAHSPLISGSFSLNIGNVQFTNISYNAGAGTIQSLINSIDGYENVLVDQVSPNGAEYNNTWIIRYVGVNGVIPNVTVSGAGLTGGSTTPTISRIVRRAYSPAITFTPIDYRFLNTFSSKINLQLTTNGIPAVCTGDCGYTFTDVAKITSLSLSGATLSLALAVTPANLSISLSSISIKVQGQDCRISPSSNLSSISCTIPTNNDGTPILMAGSVTPIVYIDPIGIAGLNTGVNAISVAL